MRSRLIIRKALSLRPPHSGASWRLFTYNPLPRTRPQLPFLNHRNRRPVARFLTTERKQWIKDEMRKAGKWIATIYATAFLGAIIYYGVKMEWLERIFPTPSEWSWVTRMDYRISREAETPDEDGNPIDWAFVASYYRYVLSRLENPKKDGAGLQDQTEGGILVEGVGKTGFDISQKSEEWRRGYYEVLMGVARGAEHLDGFLLDKTRSLVVPPSVVVGPSNPNPRPMPPGNPTAPREEDCEVAFQAPETYYMRILTTKGFTEKQRVDAALAYAAYLDYKKTPGAAYEMYRWAIDIATANSKTSSLESTRGVLDVKAGPPTENLLSATTALATHHARNGNLSTALPIFLSVLRARRSLEDPPITMLSTLPPEDDKNGVWKTMMSFVKLVLAPAPYPPPPPDGTAPPLRSPKERCEEAGIMAHIGEILYVTMSGNNPKEEGLAWTRESVDIAEDQLRKRGLNNDARKTCAQCLETGLTNWATMVSKLAREEKESRQKASEGGGWLGLKSPARADIVGRWESEEKVVTERMERAKDVLGSPVVNNLIAEFLTSETADRTTS